MKISDTIGTIDKHTICLIRKDKHLCKGDCDKCDIGQSIETLLSAFSAATKALITWEELYKALELNIDHFTQSDDEDAAKKVEVYEEVLGMVVHVMEQIEH